MNKILYAVLILLSILIVSYGDCSMLSSCNGHGTCINSTSTCVCYDGWGSPNDATFYRSPDCSLRTCPADRAWADVPLSSTVAHQPMECSNRGVCDRSSGLCTCFAGFTGSACQRSKCPNDCSGHGVCLSMRQLARMDAALPLGPNTYYEGEVDSVTWDEDRIYGCLCDSSWTVGLGNGQRQEPEWFGPDCSLRHCPSGDNPKTSNDETDCYNITAANSIYRGEVGNICHVDCSNQGICDHSTGNCKCFDGQYGGNCHYVNPNAVYEEWNSNVVVNVDDF